MINSSAAIRSTDAIDQLKALQKIFSVVLDKKTAGSTNFLFEIGRSSFIDTVNLNTSLGMIIFYIIQAYIPFLLYLTDIDKLGAFFNIFTNEFIQSNYLYSVIC